MNQVTINGKNQYNVDKDRDGNYVVDGEVLNWDIRKFNESLFHIIYQEESFIAELVKLDTEAKEASFKINNELVEVKLKDRFDLLLEKLGMAHLASKKVQDIKAPMPGLILKIIVEEGSQISKDDPLVILEAMKMENVIKSPIDGTISKIHVGIGENVEKNHKLIEFKQES